MPPKRGSEPAAPLLCWGNQVPCSLLCSCWDEDFLNLCAFGGGSSPYREQVCAGTLSIKSVHFIQLTWTSKLTSLILPDKEEQSQSTGAPEKQSVEVQTSWDEVAANTWE